MLDHLLALLRRHAPLLGDDVAEHQANLPGHVGGIAAHVEVGLLLEQVADKLSILLQSVLDVDLLGALTREGGDDLQGVAKLVLVGLEEKSQKKFSKDRQRIIYSPSTHPGR